MYKSSQNFQRNITIVTNNNDLFFSGDTFLKTENSEAKKTRFP